MSMPSPKQAAAINSVTSGPAAATRNSTPGESVSRPSFATPPNSPTISRSHVRYPVGSDNPSGWSTRTPSTRPSVNQRFTSAWVASNTARSSCRNPASDVIAKNRR
jgi:hypothetical protein